MCNFFLLKTGMKVRRKKGKSNILLTSYQISLSIIAHPYLLYAVSTHAQAHLKNGRGKDTAYMQSFKQVN